MRTLETLLESILDVDLDIKETDLTIGATYTIRVHAGLVMTSPAERSLKKAFDKYCPDFPRDLPHNDGNAFGPAMCERYFADWVCSLPSSYVDDKQFITKEPEIAKALAKIAPPKRFKVDLVNMMGKKSILFRYATGTRSTEFETFCTVKLYK